MSHDDFEFEPIRGLPALLPPGETLLWQGQPRWESLAVRTYHVRKVAIYFCALVVVRIALGIHDHHTMATIAASSAFLLVLGAIAIGVLSLLACLSAMSTVYSITTRRVLLRHGVAVPLIMNIPFNMIEAVDLRNFADGTGEISLRVARGQRVGYLITWPHVRPGKITQPAPCLKALFNAAHAAKLLGAAVAAEANTQTGTQSAAPRHGIDVGASQPGFPAHSAAA